MVFDDVPSTSMSRAVFESTSVAAAAVAAGLAGSKGKPRV